MVCLLVFGFVGCFWVVCMFWRIGIVEEVCIKCLCWCICWGICELDVLFGGWLDECFVMVDEVIWLVFDVLFDVQDFVLWDWVMGYVCVLCEDWQVIVDDICVCYWF